MKEKEQLNKLLGEIHKVQKLKPNLKGMTLEDLKRRREVYNKSKEINKERYEELIAEGFTDSDNELLVPKNEIHKLEELLKELDIIENVLTEMPLHELNRKIQVYETRKNILQERYEDLIAEGFTNEDDEIQEVNNEIREVEDLLDISKKLKAILPENFKTTGKQSKSKNVQKTSNSQKTEKKEKSETKTESSNTERTAKRTKEETKKESSNYKKVEKKVKEEPLNTEELFKEAREDGDLPPRSTKQVSKDQRTFSKEQKEAWNGEPLDTKELFEEISPKNKPENRETVENVAKIFFDLSKGEYKYIDREGQQALKVLKKDGTEFISKQNKLKIVNKLIELGVNESCAKKVDPYIYMLLDVCNPELKDKYIAALDNPIRGLEDLKIEYDLRTHKNGKKVQDTSNLSFLQKLKIKSIANYHKKNKLAKVLKSKSKTKFYAILATLGIGAGAGAVKMISDSNKNQEPEIIYYDDEITNETENATPTPIVEPTETPAPTPIVEPTKTPSETSTVSSTEVSKETKEIVEIIEKQSKLGNKVTVEMGSHLYADPTDAIKEALGKTTNNNIYVKTKNEDKIYTVTKEGLYCPDGTYVAVSDKDGEIDLKKAMEKKGINTAILDNIDTEALKEQGYKHMLHVEAEGIAQWVEEGTTSEVEYDRFGMRISKLPSEIRADKECANNQTENKEITR